MTILDQEIEKCLRQQIQKRYPSHGIIGEEFGELNSDAEFVWTLDPVDGTEELVYGVPLWGTIIALLRNRKPVLGLIDHAALDVCVVGTKGGGVFCNGNLVQQLSPLSESPRCYLASRHQFARSVDEGELFEDATRLFPNVRIYCACYAFTSIICGNADIALEANLKIWDLAAAEVLIKEVGGEFVSFAERTLGDGTPVYSAVFGKKAGVERVLGEVGICSSP